MREYKFRVWDEKEKTMWDWWDLTDEMFNNRESSIIYQIFINKISHLTIRQFTGLYDSEGKEIYEGDIIRGPKGNIHLIAYDEDEAMFKALYRWKDEPYLPKEGCAINKKWLIDYGKIVIGNIHENPELLKVTK